MYDVLAIYCATLWRVFGEVYCSVVVTFCAESRCGLVRCDGTWYYGFEGMFLHTLTLSLCACFSIVDSFSYVNVKVEVHGGE